MEWMIPSREVLEESLRSLPPYLVSYPNTKEEIGKVQELANIKVHQKVVEEILAFKL